MIVATDVHYDDAVSQARAACLTFSNWTDTAPLSEYSVIVDNVAPYETGAFYKRELPCLLAVLHMVGTPDTIGTIIVDSYVDLAPGHPGMGRHLYEVLRQRVPVIGVAKTYFKSSTATEILRGQSMSPLYVTAAGMEADVAAQFVQSMVGPHRIPSLLQRVDALSRGRN